jgi:hypothetical protein
VYSISSAAPKCITRLRAWPPRIQPILETFCVRRHDPFDIGIDTKRTALAAKDTYPEIGVIFKIITRYLNMDLLEQKETKAAA